jgi:ABC-type sugar transport system permease subunit
MKPKITLANVWRGFGFVLVFAGTGLHSILKEKNQDENDFNPFT